MGVNSLNSFKIELASAVDNLHKGIKYKKLRDLRQFTLGFGSEKRVKPISTNTVSALTVKEDKELRWFIQNELNRAIDPLVNNMRGQRGLHYDKKALKKACKTALLIRKVCPELVPPDYFVEKYVNPKDTFGRNILMTLWDSKLWKLIPKELLREKTLCDTDNYGSTCFHLAALRQALNKIPQELLIEDNLIQRKDKEGNTALHRAILGLKGFPKKLLKPEFLLLKNKINQTPIDVLCENFNQERDAKNLQFLAKTLPTKVLKDLKNRYDQTELRRILSKEIIIRCVKSKITQKTDRSHQEDWVL